MKPLFIVGIAFAMFGFPVQAESILAPMLGSVGDCYYRAYDADHLADHPDQLVTEFSLSHNAEFQDTGAELTLLFGITKRDGNRYEGVGLCVGNVCGVEGDGGGFTLNPHRDGLRLEIDPERGMHAEGEAGFIALEDSDDKVFLLYEASAKTCK